MRARSALLLLPSLLLAACGAMTAPIDDPVDGGMRRMPEPELCNGLDDDLNGVVDDGFRDELGRYVQLANCGRCGTPCPATLAHATGVACELIEGTPSCVATTCVMGFARSSTGVCIPAYDRLCLPCADDGDCGDFPQAHCDDVGSESRCTVDCTLGCPSGYACTAGRCIPSGGSCSCMPGDTFHLACALHDPTGMLCPGSADCTDGTLSMCLAPMEICDHADNDCNGADDDPYVDVRGAYSVDVHNCGDCGVDCTTSGVGLTCGGDPFAPHCILDCPDTHDGIQVGDHVDANGVIADGCECVVGSLGDVPGPVRTSGQTLDTNCDGADGVVVESFYVAPGGDDTGPGSPTHPLATVTTAFMRAAATIGSSAPRTHVFIASGVYPESVTLPDGVKVHGGYRRDFLSLDPDGFLVEIRAPASATAPGGAALQVLGAGTTETSIEWLTVHGIDAAGGGAAAFGAYLRDPGAMLSLRDMHVQAGAGGSGNQGLNGAPSTTSITGPHGGGVQRAAIEDTSHTCLPSVADNQVQGGDGGHATCVGVGVDVSGGAGGTATCPHFMTEQNAGVGGGGPGGGGGGRGGDDSQAPITDTCPGGGICCGLADFTVWDGFQGPSPGASGTSGASGSAGRGCMDAFGRFDGDTWAPDVASGGTAGTPGGGGGGGGAGGGAEFEWTAPMCEFADAIGGGGGGGGAGGCGGGSGSPGTSGGPSIAIVVRYTSGVVATVPTIRGVTITSADGGRGGDGGAGGDGALGQTGAPGGEVPRSARTTPSLAGGFPGGRGGKGGDGGPGGGGGGGCGGASVGVWVTGVSSAPGSDAWRTANTFLAGSGGSAGAGGGGGAAAANGMAGGTDDVLVR